MDNEAVKESWDSFLDETISQYIDSFTREHTQYARLKERHDGLFEALCLAVPANSQPLVTEIKVVGNYKADILGAFMYAKGLKDGMLTVGYLDKGYIEQELTRCEITIQNMLHNEEA